MPLSAPNAPHTPSSASPERGAWHSVSAGWRQLYGSFDSLGISVEMHHFRTDTPLDWARSFHPESVEICLNTSGRGEVTTGRKSMVFNGNALGFYSIGADRMRAERAAGEWHRFVTFEFSREFLAKQLAGSEDNLDEPVRDTVFGRKSRPLFGDPRPLSPGQQRLATIIDDPPVGPAASSLWYQSKVLEIVAESFFPPRQEELFCSRQKRLARERVDRVAAILQRRLEDPPSLEVLGREVGVSPFYLSRLFSEQMRMTIPQYLRRIRMERAAELLIGGRHNVTEAAFAVGYSSLGHFSKSFCEVIGCCPTLYPAARALVASGRRC